MRIDENLSQKIINMRNALTELFVGREQEITAVLAGLFSNEPVALIGTVGTAKTKLISTLAKLCSAKYFYYLLNRFTEPDELLGAIDIQEYKKGIYKRITKNRLPDSNIVFLDEVFKASSAVRNILLDIMLNKRFLNGIEYEQLPMLGLYVASNEISYDTEDQAFYDRLTIRDFVRNLPANLWEELIIKGIALEVNGIQIEPILSYEEILQIQKATILRLTQIPKSKTFLGKYLRALALLEEKGLQISDRRKIKVLKVASAISILYLEDTISLDSLADALRFVCIQEESDIQKVEEVIQQAKLSRFSEQIEKISALIAELQNTLETAKSNSTAETLKALRIIMKRTVVEIKSLPKNPRFLPLVQKAFSLVTESKRFIEEKKRELFGEEEE